MAAVLRALLALVLVAASGCGPDAAVLLRIEAPLRVPEECDALRVKAVRTSDGETIYEAEHAVEVQFPMDLLLTTTNEENLGIRRVEISAEALKSGARARPWSSAVIQIDLVEGRTEGARIELCDCSL